MLRSVVVGTYTGTGAAVKLDLGFIPDHIRVVNTTDNNAAHEWFDNMADGTALVAQGAMSLLATNGVTKVAGDRTTQAGLSMGTALSVNAKVYRYVAHRNVP